MAASVAVRVGIQEALINVAATWSSLVVQLVRGVNCEPVRLVSTSAFDEDVRDNTGIWLAGRGVVSRWYVIRFRIPSRSRSSRRHASERLPGVAARVGGPNRA